MAKIVERLAGQETRFLPPLGAEELDPTLGVLIEREVVK